MKQKFSAKEKEAIAKKDDWDFRGIPEDMMWVADTYEYAREVHWIVEDFKGWHDAKLKLRRDAEGFKEWNGRTVFEVLTFDNPDDPDETVPYDVVQAAYELQPPHFKEPLFDALLDCSRLFPKPFLEVLPQALSFKEAGLLDHLIEIPRKKRSTVTILPKMKYSEREIETYARLGIQIRQVIYDLRFGTTILRADGGASAVALYKKCPPPTPMKKGAATWSDVPLKELAAYRLHKYGLRGEAANEFLTKYSYDGKNLKRTKWLPIYGSATGGFLNAVNNAKNRVKEFTDTGRLSL